MKEQYRWNYQIRIKTKEETYEYEKEDLTDMDELIEKHPDYEEIQAKRRVKKRENRRLRKD